MIELREICSTNCPSIVGITESWLTDQIKDSEVDITGMKITRCDRRTGKGGGVALYLKEGLKTCSVKDELFQTIPESIWQELHINSLTKCLIGLVYRPPSANLEYDQLLNDVVRRIPSLRYEHVLLMGDFNFPEISFRDLSVRGTTSRASDFLDAVLDAGLFEQVQNITRWREHQQCSCLDYVLTNEQHMVDHLELGEPLGLSDHCMISFEYLYRVELHLPDRLFLKNYHRADFISIRTYFMDVNWDEITAHLTIDDHWETVLREINYAVDRYVPVKQPGKKKKDKIIRAKTRRLILSKRLAWHKYRHDQTLESYTAYRELRNKVVAAVRSDKLTHQKLLVEKISKNTKFFYSTLAEHTRSRVGISQLRSIEGLTSNDTEAANILGAQYQSVYPANQNPSPSLDTNPPDTITELTFFSFEVLSKLLRLRVNKSPGPDMVNPLLLKHCAMELADPLTDLFNHSVRTGHLPGNWKSYTITPVYKGGPRDSPASYRPIALLSIVSKILESLMEDKLRMSLKHLDLLPIQQHGFRKGYSCVTNLILARDAWTKAADAGLPIDVIYLDFSKAFDRVDHKILLQKLTGCGIDHVYLRWLQDYLTGRHFNVKVNGSLSNWFQATSGVPQGSILGPLLFILFILELPKIVDSDLLLYADDTKIWRTVETEDDTKVLQKDLDKLHSWSISNNLPFNTGKCKIMHIRHRGTVTYKLGGVQLQTTPVEKDLGTLVSENLSLSANTSAMVKKASTALNLLSRVFGKFHPKHFSTMFNSTVRPVLETNIQACRPYLKKDIERLESVQRRATKSVVGLAGLSYTERLNRLSQTTIYYRHCIADLILVFKILHNTNHPLRHLFVLRNDDRLRGHSLTIKHQTNKLMCRQSSFALRVCSPWNALPQWVVNARSVPEFRKLL
ncbi:MAG: reverse transcriptase family protein, partial [Candidatus Thiodiazotropha sp.]